MGTIVRGSDGVGADASTRHPGWARPRIPLVPHFKGNKQSLPSKPCAVCGREMTWRKAWAKNWDEVRYCSQACRKNNGRVATTAPVVRPRTGSARRDR